MFILLVANKTSMYLTYLSGRFCSLSQSQTFYECAKDCFQNDLIVIVFRFFSTRGSQSWTISSRVNTDRVQEKGAENTMDGTSN